MSILRRLPNSRMSSLAEVIRAELSEHLNDYFANQKFHFTDKSQVKLLQTQISQVYLRSGPLVSIDVEAFERNQEKVTEIGIAVYDPEYQWLLSYPKIKTIHILAEENMRLRNGQFVADRKFNFNGGTSYAMLQETLKLFVQEIFEYYFRDRDGILVGHDVKGDLKWLSKLGIHLSPKTPTVDTLKIYSLTTRRNGSLRKILRRMNIPHANLHNAANDAYYTLLAAMSICDPDQRVHSRLDVYEEEESVPMTKQEKWRAKYCDEVEVLRHNAVPTSEDFITYF